MLWDFFPLSHKQIDICQPSTGERQPLKACHGQVGHLPKQNILKFHTGLRYLPQHLVIHGRATRQRQAAQLGQLRQNPEPLRSLDIVRPNRQSTQVPAVAKQRHYVVLVEETVVAHL